MQCTDQWKTGSESPEFTGGYSRQVFENVQAGSIRSVACNPSASPPDTFRIREGVPATPALARSSSRPNPCGTAHVN